MGSAFGILISPQLATLVMEEEQKNVTKQVITQEGKKLKICCACPETRELRDTCIVENGQENCVTQINNHIECLRKLGFDM